MKKGGEQLRNLCKILFVFLFILATPISASALKLIPMGHTVEVALQFQSIVFTKDFKLGSKVEIQRGDELIKVNGKSVNSINKLPSTLSNSIDVVTSRNGHSKKYTVNKTEWQSMLLNMKDTTEGIGTVTYIDPKSKVFGALGHAIVDQSLDIVPKITTGYIYLTRIHDVEKSTQGVPGYKITKSDINKYPVGEVESNTIVGVFGNWHHHIDKSLHEPIEIMQENEISKGEATILTQIEGNKISTFKINITEVSDEGIIFEITDKKLIEKTGGIVQGMSGSPIIQDGKFAGAITHMFVENPKKGAGIFIGEMIKSS